MRPPLLALALLAVYTLGHVAGKAGWYWLGTYSERVRHDRAQAFIARARVIIAAHPAYGVGVLAASAVISVPPFHLAAIAAGIARVPFVRFVLVCLAGRFLRFAVVAALPALLAEWLR